MKFETNFSQALVKTWALLPGLSFMIHLPLGSFTHSTKTVLIPDTWPLPSSRNSYKQHSTIRCSTTHNFILPRKSFFENFHPITNLKKENMKYLAVIGKRMGYWCLSIETNSKRKSLSSDTVFFSKNDIKCLMGQQLCTVHYRRIFETGLLIY